MKINKQYDIQGKYFDNVNNKSKEWNKKASMVKENENISIQISTSAKKLIDRINNIEDTEFSEEVEKIRKLVLDGKYPISSEKIAEKILHRIEEQKGSEVE